MIRRWNLKILWAGIKGSLPRKRIGFNELPNWNSLTIDAHTIFVMKF